MRVLLVEDDAVTSEVVQNALISQHYLVDMAADGQIGWELAEAFSYDLILLDLLLPCLDGIDFCQRLRGSQLDRSPNRQTPILLITSKAASAAKVSALDAGADDYLVKPFDLDELLARVRALLRRGNTLQSPLLTWETVQLDPSTCEVTVATRPIHLSLKEYRLLELLLRSPKRIFSTSYLIEQLWAEEIPTENAVRAQIKGLRKRLKEAGSGEMIETVYGLGYRLREETGRKGISPTAVVSSHSSVTSKATAYNDQGTINALFEKYQAGYCERLAVIEQATIALRQQNLSEELRQQAYREAHTLKGSLGLFEMEAASQLSMEIEQILQSDSIREHVQQLEQRVNQLKQYLVDGHPSSTLAAIVPRSIGMTRSLWIIGNQPTLVNEFIEAAPTYSVQVDVFSSLAEVSDRLSQASPNAILLILSTQAEPEDWVRLHTLFAHYPQIPLFVIAPIETQAPETLEQRLKVAQLGAKGFWQGVVTSGTILQTIIEFLQSVREDTTKILIVDDDFAMLEALQTILHPWGFDLTFIHDPHEFWGTLEQVQPDLVILDIEMPEVSGIELCQIVRQDEQWGDLPILFLSAHTDDATLHKIFTIGADDYVSKPVREVELVSRVLRRLEQARLLQRLHQLKGQ